jgi:hypothetical protein
MGLDTTHDCWSGAYSAFHRWRVALADAADIQLMDMAGYKKGTKFQTPPGKDGLPKPWDQYKEDPLTVLLRHSDCDGFIPVEWCKPLADRLEGLIPFIKSDEGEWGHLGGGYGHAEGYVDATKRFVAGLRLAAIRGENVEFR